MVYDTPLCSLLFTKYGKQGESQNLIISPPSVNHFKPNTKQLLGVLFSNVQECAPTSTSIHFNESDLQLSMARKWQMGQIWIVSSLSWRDSGVGWSLRKLGEVRTRLADMFAGDPLLNTITWQWNGQCFQSMRLYAWALPKLSSYTLSILVGWSLSKQSWVEDRAANG